MLEGKIIVLISHQKWGNMFLSKHNYALELAEHNKVYFLESPDVNHKSEITLIQSNESPNLKIVKNGITNIYRYRYLGKLFLKMALNWKVSKIKKVINKKIDLLISFDNHGLYPFMEQFDAKKHVFIPVDAPASPLTKFISYPNQYLFSISESVADKYSYLNKKTIILNHGLSRFWQNIAEKNLTEHYVPNVNLKFGFIGNLLKGKIQDTQTLKKVITTLNNIEFHFWGPYDPKQSNVGSKVKDDNYDWISFLKKRPNVFLHGVLHPRELCSEANKMDGFFICKDDLFDHNKSSNSHKIMEYLSTGKVVVSSHLSSYVDFPNFIAMPTTTSNDTYVDIFENVTNNISFFNNENLIKSRINFVLQNTYGKNIDIMYKTILT